eukprot:1082527-Pleurochrysis_carterae.AAC.9
MLLASCLDRLEALENYLANVSFKAKRGLPAKLTQQGRIQPNDCRSSLYLRASGPFTLQHRTVRPVGLDPYGRLNGISVGSPVAVPLRLAPSTSGLVNIQMVMGYSRFHSRLHTQRCRTASSYERQVWRRRPACRCVA